MLRMKEGWVFACGTSVYTRELASHFKEMHAIDISSKMIEVAERRAVELKIENLRYS
jgi:ubiquinone/menaquinone biosynthesis C-methylase UbiE